MKIQKQADSFKVLSANTGFAPGYFTIIGSQVRNGDSKKPPMLVVGGNNFLKDYIDTRLEKNYNVFVFFYPTNKAVWVMGLFLMHKQDITKYYAVYSEDCNIKNAITKCFQCVYDIVDFKPNKDVFTKNEEKLAIWITNWVYRLPKISLKDILHLEDYEEEQKTG